MYIIFFFLLLLHNQCQIKLTFYYQVLIDYLNIQNIFVLNLQSLKMFE